MRRRAGKIKINLQGNSMDDKTTSSPDMTEYKFAEADGVPEGAATDPGSAASGGEAPAPASSGFSLKFIDMRRAIMLGAVLVAIALLYGGFDFYNTKKMRATELQKAQVQDMAQQQATIVAPSIKEVESSPSFNGDQIAMVQTAIQQKINTVEQEMANNRDQLSGLRDSVSKAQQDISSVSQNISQLTVAMQQLLTEIQQLKLQAPKTSKSRKRAAKPLPIYHVRAIVPGRVWIESADGKGVTLRVGDTLEGYGTVEVIAPRQGMVLMSDGSYIQYGVNDF